MSAPACSCCGGELDPSAWGICPPCADRLKRLDADARAVVLEILGRPQRDQRTRVIGFTFEVERVTSSRHTFTGFPIVAKDGGA